VKLAPQNVGKVVKAAGYTKAGRYVGMGYQSQGYEVSSTRDYSYWSKGARGNDIPFKEISVALVGGVKNANDEIEKLAEVLKQYWNVQVILRTGNSGYAQVRLTAKITPRPEEAP
jgi:hypothetical protein